MRDELDKYQQSFQNMEGKIHVLEHQIPLEEQMDYFRESKDWKELTKKEKFFDESKCEEWFDKVCLGEGDMEQQKTYIIRLANSRQPKAFTYLKQLTDICENPELKNWIYMAIIDIQMALESEMSGEKQVYVATGLGGKGEELLFCILLYSRTLKPFEAYQKDIVEREFNYVLLRENCDVDRIEVGEVSVKLMIYIPFRASIRHLMAKAIGSCNEYGDFLSEHYTITNVKELNEDEIKEAIEVYRKNEDIGTSD